MRTEHAPIERITSNLCLLIVMIFGLTTATSAGITAPVMSQPPENIIIVIPPETTDGVVIDSIKELSVQLPPQVPVNVFDGWSGQSIARFETPSGRSSALKTRKLNKSLKPLTEYLEQRKSVRTAKGNQVALARMLDTVAASIRPGVSQTRVIVFGSLFYEDDQEPHASFRPGFVPSPGHITASSDRSLYGSADKQGVLDGVTVDICTLGERVGAIEQRAVVNFWAALCQERGAVLSSVEAYPGVILDRVVAGVTDPVVRPELDREDTAIEIRPVKTKDRVIVPPKPVTVPEDPEQASAKTIPHPEKPDEIIGAAIVIVIDGTSSQKHVLPRVADLLMKVAEIGATEGDFLQLGVVVFRSRGSFDMFDLTVIERGQSSPGMQSLKRFTSVPVKSVPLVAGANNESGGEPTGESRMVTAMAPLLSFADLEGGVKKGVSMLKRSGATRQILLIVGDVGTYEYDRDPISISGQDLASASRTKAVLTDFVQARPEARVVTLFTGPESGFHRHRDETIVQFKDFAGVAGRYGTYTDEFADIERIVKRGVRGM